MRRHATALVAMLLAACGGSSKEDPPVTAAAPGQAVGNPAGQRAFSGSFQNGANLGSCTVLVPPAGTGAIATTGRCATATATADLTGTYTAQAAAGAGTLNVSNGTWSISASIGGATTGLGALSGTLTIGATSVSLLLTDSTVDPVTAYCGTAAKDSAPTVATDAFLLQVNSGVVQGVSHHYSDGSALLLIGGRSGVDLAINACDLSRCLPIATGTVGASSISGTWRDPLLATPGPSDRGPWSGTVCPGTAAGVTCCGSGTKTRCCIGVGCTCTPGT